MVWSAKAISEMQHHSYLTEALSANLLLLRSLTEGKRESSHRRLMLFYPFLTAKPKHIRKYSALFTNIGIDILVVKTTLLQSLDPVTGPQMVADEVCDFLLYNLPNYDKIVCYSLSIGAYIYSETCIKIDGRKGLRAALEEKLVGQIWECPLSVGEAAVGLAEGLTNNKLLLSVLKFITRLYLKVYCESKTQHYIRAFDYSYQCPLNAPGLCIYSTGDVVSPPSVSKFCVKKMALRNVIVKLKAFHGVPHCQNFSHSPQEYKTAIFSYLATTGIVSEREYKSVIEP